MCMHACNCNQNLLFVCWVLWGRYLFKSVEEFMLCCIIPVLLYVELEKMCLCQLYASGSCHKKEGVVLLLGYKFHVDKFLSSSKKVLLSALIYISKTCCVRHKLHNEHTSADGFWCLTLDMLWMLGCMCLCVLSHQNMLSISSLPLFYVIGYTSNGTARIPWGPKCPFQCVLL